MIVLFAPSEGKRSGGDLPPIDATAFCCPDLFDKRLEAVRRYRDYLKTADEGALQKLFGVKKADQLAAYRAVDPLVAPTMKAILRYDGVAYEYLDYPSLDQESRDFIESRVLIFSNLFGPLMAGDRIPEYKLKQGEKIGDFAPEKFFKTHFSEALDDRVASHTLILDLRAGFYEKFYKITRPYVTMKFLKNGKSVSHWAKAYRGLVLRAVAQGRIETLEDLRRLPIQGLSIDRIVETPDRIEFVYEIVE